VERLLLRSTSDIFFLLLLLPLLLDLNSSADVEGWLGLGSHEHQLLGLLLIFPNILVELEIVANLLLHSALHPWIKLPVLV
jgi:hypothetical protein